MNINKYWRVLLSFLLAIFLVGITSPLVASQNETNGVIPKTSIEMLQNYCKAIEDEVLLKQPSARAICEEIEKAANSEKSSRAENTIRAKIIRGTQVALGIYFLIVLSFYGWHSLFNRNYDITQNTNWMLRLLIREFITIVLLPISAGIAICLVIIFEQISGNIEFSILGLEFKGASGPIIFWILCYLALVTGLKLFWVGESKT